LVGEADGSGLSVPMTIMLAMTAIGAVRLFRGAAQFAADPGGGDQAAAHKASGLALALGNLLASVLALAFTAWAFALPGKVDLVVGALEAPLFGLDPAAHEPERVVALMAALPSSRSAPCRCSCSPRTRPADRHPHAEGLQPTAPATCSDDPGP
jgi:hypothetical protein